MLFIVITRGEGQAGESPPAKKFLRLICSIYSRLFTIQCSWQCGRGMRMQIKCKQTRQIGNRILSMNKKRFHSSQKMQIIIGRTNLGCSLRLWANIMRNWTEITKVLFFFCSLSVCSGLIRFCIKGNILFTVCDAQCGILYCGILMGNIDGEYWTI